MANNVIVSPSASYTVAAEDIGVSVEVQRVKVVLGTAGVDGGNVGLTNPMPVTGTVAVPAGLSVSAQVSGTVTVSAGVSVSAVVSGTVTAAVPAGLSVSAVVSGTVTAVVTGPVSISAMPAISISVSAALGTVVTVLGTVAVNVVAGGAGGGSVTTAVPSISATGQVMWIAGGQSTTAFPIVVTGTVTAGAGTTVVSIGNIVPVTTQASVSVTGLPVWLNPTQAVVVNTIAAGFSVNALVTGVVSVSVLPAVSISVSAALGTIITILGTQVVSVVPGLSVSALVSISVMPAVSISVSAVLGTVITILGTQVVSVVPGLSVSGVVSGTVTAVVTGPVSISAMPAISISVSAILGTVVTLLGTVLVSQAGLKFTTATPTVTETGPVVWLANTVTVTVTATVTGSLIISGIAIVTTQASVSVSGLPVWMNPTQGVLANISVSAALGTVITILGTQVVSVVPGVSVLASLSAAPNVVAGLASGATGIPVWPGTPAYSPVVIYITSTAIAQSAAVYLMTVWTGGIVAAAGTTAYPVPAGKNLRIRNIQFAINSSAVTGGTVVVMAVGATATASHVSGSVATQPHIAMLQMLVSAGVIAGSIDGGQGDLIAATTLAIVIQASTAAQAVGGIIQGYLF